jgi:hypothetical protein
MATRSREFWSDHGLLIGGSVVLWAIVLAGGWLGYRYVSPLLAAFYRVEIPPGLAEAGVVHGTGALAGPGRSWPMPAARSSGG